jgi:hypothetical protein
MTTPSIALQPPRRARAPAMAFPLVLISLGLLLLLANAGYVDRFSLTRLLELWPVLIVLVGVDLLLRDRSAAVAFVLEVAIIGASVAYALAGPTSLVPAGTKNTTVGRDTAQSLALVVNYGAGRLTLQGGATDLVQVASSREDVRVQDVRRAGSAASVTISPTGEDVFLGPDRAWIVRVPSDIPVALTANLGAGDFDLDLRDVQVQTATISNGASDLVVRLPKAKGQVPITISTGASSVTIEIPAGVAYRVRTTGGLNTVSGVEETSSYGSASDRFTIVVSAGASAISIR